MTGIQVAKEVVKTQQLHLVRNRQGTLGEYDAKPAHTGKAKGWFYVDLFSASAIVAVWEALNEENRAKFEKLPIARMAEVAFQVSR